MSKSKKTVETPNDFASLMNGTVNLSEVETVPSLEIKEETKQDEKPVVRWATREERKSLTHEGREINEGKNGKAGMFYLRDFEPTKDWQGCAELAGDNYTVEKSPVVYFDNEGNKRYATDYSVTHRSDNGEFLGVVSGETEIYQPNEIWTDIIRPLVEEIPGAQVISHIKGPFGGSDMIQGVQVSLGSYSPTGDIKDTSVSYASVLQSWDNVHSLKFKGPVSLRAVCNNTLAHQAISWAIKHRSDMREKIKEALELYMGIRKIDQKQQETLARMTTVKIGDNEVENLFSNLMLSDFDRLLGKRADRNPFEVAPEYAELTKRGGKALTGFDNSMSEFQRLLVADEGGGVAPGTVYGAYQALSTFANHSRRTRVTEGKSETQVRLDSQLFGSGEQWHRTAFGVLSTLS